MPSELGQLIASTRKARGLGLRALARKVGKSPSFLVTIEKNNPPPGVSEATLHRIAEALQLDPDRLITLAGKTPDDVVPTDELEVALYRLVKRLSREQKQRLLRRLQRNAP